MAERLGSCSLQPVKLAAAHNWDTHQPQINVISFSRIIFSYYSRSGVREIEKRQLKMLTRKSILSFRPLSPMHSFGIGRFVRCEFTPAFASASVTSPRREECGPRIQPGPSVAKETRHRNHHNVHRHLLPTNGVSLSPSQVKDLLRGRFPADYERDVIVLKDVPYREYRKIVDAFNYSRARYLLSLYIRCLQHRY